MFTAEHTVKIIQKVMEQFEFNTCLEFIDISEDAEARYLMNDYINFVRGNSWYTLVHVTLIYMYTV